MSFLAYVEDYWIQPKVALTVDGEWNNYGRIPIKLYKFNPANDWALFEKGRWTTIRSFRSYR
jgi:hypothetical protein